MFGSTTCATSCGQLWIGNLTRREFERMALAAEYRRDAAYRRLALTILGLDIRSLLHALPLARKETTIREGDA